VSILAVFVALAAGAQEPSTPTPPEPTDSGWDFSLSAYGYFVPDDSNYVQPTLTADRRRLHLELRYNYEDLDTGSAWVGYNCTAGEQFSLTFTPMLGVVLGDTTGIAPGYHFSLDCRMLEVYTEGEYVLDRDERTDSFFYSWSELTFSPPGWLRAGMVVQRTRAYEGDRMIQRGLLVGVRSKRLAITAHVFNPDDSDPLYVLAASLEF
jgi:hypothetical protein